MSDLRLRVEPAVGEPFTHPLEEETLVIGRASTADLRVEDRFMSRRHTRLFRSEGVLMVEDLGSRNGTLVNEMRIDGPTLVRPGDIVTLSGTRIVVESAAAAAVDPSAGSKTQLFKDPSSFLPRDPGPDSGTDARALRHYADRLKVMNEVHEALAGSLSLDRLLALILDRVFEHLGPQQAVILLRNDGGEYRPAARRSTGGSGEELFYSRSLEREVGEKRQAALVLDTASDERFAHAQSILDSGVRSILAAPLLQGERTLGMIVLSSRKNMRPFGEDDLALLVSLASVAAMRIHNVELLEEAAERRRLEAELALARTIQERLLPKRLPEIEGYQLIGKNVPSRWVSGDYYTVVERATDDGAQCVLLVADVSGKGMAASLLTASLEALAADPIEAGRPPEDICARVSRRLYQRTPTEKYATGFVAVLDPESGAVVYCNAGHNPGLVVRPGGEIEVLGPTGTPLGLLPEVSFSQAETRLGPGETLVLYTDGVTEATDPDDVEFGLDRLSEVCRRHGESSLEELAAAIEEGLWHFARGVLYADDQTLVMLRREASPA